VDEIRHRLQALWRRDIKRRFIAGGLDLAAALARAGIMPGARGRGAIFTLHHVRPWTPRAFQPSAHLEITPDFLDQALERLTAEGYEFIRLEDVPARLAGTSKRPFAAFTLDDGNRNNVEHALPVFERHGVPFTVFVAQGFAERTHTLWWETVAEVLGRAWEITFDFGTGPETLDTGSEAKKFDAFDRFSNYVGHLDERTAVSGIDRFARTFGVEPLEITAELTMDAAELAKLALHPLATLGAHTVSHRAVSRLTDDEARSEMTRSADWIEGLTGRRPVEIAYPYGYRRAVGQRDQDIAAALGFTVGVTTQPGTLSAASMARPTGLPRISLNGHYQQARFVSALAAGIPFALKRQP
jgi:peptidoglycan/xylan/chitin deacetylase (PgdA/CDA1 family)